MKKGVERGVGEEGGRNVGNHQGGKGCDFETAFGVIGGGGRNDRNSIHPGQTEQDSPESLQNGQIGTGRIETGKLSPN